MTIEQYATTYAIIESGAIHSSMNTFFKWAKEDKESPIAKAIESGDTEEKVWETYLNAYTDAQKIIAKFES